MTAELSVRSEADHCPGLLRLHEAADGLLARVRLPGGLVTASALHALADAAVLLGDGRLELTSRGNVQLRGLTDPAAGELADRLGPSGLLPAPSHEVARNIVASPLAGIDAPHDLTRIVRALDAGICDVAAFAELSGRFLFGIDDGRGDIGALEPDVLAVVRGDAAWVEGLPCHRNEVAALMVRAAHEFWLERGARQAHAWRVRDLPDGRRRLRDRLGAPVHADPGLPPAPPAPIGTVRRHDGGSALVVAPPLGRITADQARWLAAHAAGQRLRITPSRRVVLPIAPCADPAQVGLVSDGRSPWLSVSACAGRPRCGKALADVQADAAAALDRFAGRRVHWSGCGRRCGRSADVELDVVATAEGYEFVGS